MRGARSGVPLLFQQPRHTRGFLFVRKAYFMSDTEDLNSRIAVLQNQTSSVQNIVGAVEERQRGIATAVTRLEAGHASVLDSLGRIEEQLERLQKSNEATNLLTASHESRLNNLDTSIKWGGGIAASLMAALLAKIFGLH